MVTAQSFKPANLDGTPVSDAQMQALEQAIRYLSQDAEAAALLKQAVDSGVTIKFYSEMNGGYIPDDHHIRWNPEFSLEVESGTDRGYTSPALMLLHEVAHSVDKQIAHYQPMDKQTYEQYLHPSCIKSPSAAECVPRGANMKLVYTSDSYLLDMRNAAEKLAVETEQRIARRLGEPIRTTYLDAVGDKTVPSPLHSSREYIRNGKLYQEESKGHAQEADGSVYTKVQTVSVNGVTESRNTSKFDEQFKKISQTVDTYDYTQGTITSTKTDYQNLDADGKPAVTRSVTDLNGNPVQAPQAESQKSETSQASNPGPFNDPYLDKYFAAVMAGDDKLADQAAIAFAQSPQGQAMAEEGRRLLAEQELQQQQDQQVRMQHAPVMKI